MQKLKQANLYGSDLIEVSGQMTKRYNTCLKKMGFLPTKLNYFSVDGMGWSPEIAEEKGNPYYLNHGDANIHAIIISPLQKNKPVYFPFHSFDRDMMRFVFKVYEKQIKDITRDSAICIGFDHGVDKLYHPLDVVKYKKVSINFRLINDLDKKQEEQQKLIDLFNQDNHFIDESIHNKLIESAKKYGDLRNRVLSLSNVPFQFNSFYTKAMGGIFVFRDFIVPIVVFQSMETYNKAIKDTHHNVLIYHTSHSELLEKMKDHLILEFDMSKIIDTERYQRIKKYVFAQEVKNAEHDLTDILEDLVLFRRYLNRMDAQAVKRINGMELYLERSKRSTAYSISDFIAPDVYVALHSPHSSLDTSNQELVWKLLTTIAPLDILHVFWYKKDFFYTLFKEWEPTLQDWVINSIRNNIN